MFERNLSRILKLFLFLFLHKNWGSSVLFCLSEDVDFSGEAILCVFFNKMQYFQRKCPWYVSFIVHSHFKKISNIHHILMKLESSFVLDE